jgi:hypothetical protein
MALDAVPRTLYLSYDFTVITTSARIINRISFCPKAVKKRAYSDFRCDKLKIWNSLSAVPEKWFPSVAAVYRINNQFHERRSWIQEKHSKSRLWQEHFEFIEEEEVYSLEF